MRIKDLWILVFIFFMILLIYDIAPQPVEAISPKIYLEPVFNGTAFLCNETQNVYLKFANKSTLMVFCR